MFGAGFVMDMIQSLKNNKRNRITKFDKEVDKHTSIYSKLKDHKKMSPEEFISFQEKLKANNRQNRRRLLLVFSTVMLFILAVIIYFLFFFEIAPAKPIKFKVN
ncbi:hypothetical protein [uncultured Marixanthomonas sp.]|uniref:hypothetical protein n=1 Tax=uncultured Marixanthomonas sp. TaxID=757245 RepID=UPI0030D9E290|tara:strand:+ start:154030 stop:154341 length:312 start_codon:yes stop_codon:yes gene_type:complete